MSDNRQQPTPETDEQINGKPCTRFAVMAGDSLRDALIPAEFARKLERERDEARAALSGRTVSCGACNESAKAFHESREEFNELKAIHTDMCVRLQECVQRWNLGLGGENLSMLVVAEIARLRALVKEAHHLLSECREDSNPT